MPKKNSLNLVLAGDVGGTNARLRLTTQDGSKVVHEQTFSSRSAKSLAAILGPYVKSAPGRVKAAVLGIAGPVVDGVSRATNLPWIIDEHKLERALSIPRVRLVNDMAAIAIGCTCLPPGARKTISKGRPPKVGNAAVIAAGTGLGEGLMVWEAGKYLPTSSEGGHCDFAPRNQLEDELLRFLRKDNASGHVSYERVLSGPGIGALYDFFRGREDIAEPDEVEQALRDGDRNAAITQLGLSGRSLAARRAIDMFASVYGAETGNLALKGLATRGVYVCGRIASEIVPQRKQLFLDAMLDKGRLRAVIERVPVHLVNNDLVGLLGASFLAARLATEG